LARSFSGRNGHNLPPPSEPPALDHRGNRSRRPAPYREHWVRAEGRPAEIFLSVAKDGSGPAALLGDDAVAISVALQRGISALALGLSAGRLPETVDGPAILPASPIGAALDLLAAYEWGEE
jgi:hypothetical protein